MLVHCMLNSDFESNMLKYLSLFGFSSVTNLSTIVIGFKNFFLLTKNFVIKNMKNCLIIILNRKKINSFVFLI